MHQNNIFFLFFKIYFLKFIFDINTLKQFENTSKIKYLNFQKPLFELHSQTGAKFQKPLRGPFRNLMLPLKMPLSSNSLPKCTCTLIWNLDMGSEPI